LIAFEEDEEGIDAINPDANDDLSLVDLMERECPLISSLEVVHIQQQQDYEVTAEFDIDAITIAVTPQECAQRVADCGISVFSTIRRYLSSPQFHYVLCDNVGLATLNSVSF
jgi:hypothetical protein